jgi:hypothetical protein
MSDDETVFSRWSRRKREAVRKTAEAARPETAGAPEPPPAPAPPLPDAPAAGAESLPPIDSIDAGTDIRAFLAAGVPAEVSRAALRRAWSSDPAIRDFIGLSENSWDFTAPDGVPGFGTLTADDVRRLLARLTDPEAEDPAPAPDTLPTQPAPEAPVEGRAAPEQTGHTGDSPALPQSKDAALQHESVSYAEEPHESDEGEQRHRRLHGTALPE